MRALALSSLAARMMPTMSGRSVPMSPNAPASSLRSKRMAPWLGWISVGAMVMRQARDGGLIAVKFLPADGGHDPPGLPVVPELMFRGLPGESLLEAGGKLGLVDEGTQGRLE